MQPSGSKLTSLKHATYWKCTMGSEISRKRKWSILRLQSKLTTGGSITTEKCPEVFFFENVQRFRIKLHADRNNRKM